MTERQSLWAFRLLALAMAVAIWYAVAVENREQKSEKVVEASVTYNKPAGLILLKPVQTVSVRLRGNTRSIRQLTPYEVDVQVAIEQRTKGTTTVTLSPDNVQMPEGLEVIAIEPNVLTLQLDAEVTRTLPVEVQLVGEPAAGATVEDVRLVPDAIKVSGPESMLDKVRSLRTNPVNLDGHALSFEEPTTVVSPDPLIRLDETSLVTIRVEMQPPRSTKGGGV